MELLLLLVRILFQTLLQEKTPGQYEQEYLAERLDALQIVPFCSQNEFKLKDLDRVEDYEGLSVFSESIDWSSLFKEAF